MIFDVINSLGRLLLTAVVIYKITSFRETMNLLERCGLGMMGGGSFLTIALIWDQHGPFQGWSVTTLTYGAVAFLGGRTWRDMQHERNNKRAARQADGWLNGRGKL